MKTSFALGICTLLFLIAPRTFGMTYKFDAEEGEVIFYAKGKPSMMSIKGIGKGISGQLIETQSKLSGTIEFDLKSLDTEIELRNDHMKDRYLEVKKYPKAILHLKDLDLPPTQDFPFTGELELKGEKKPVSGKIRKSGDHQIEAEFDLKLSHYPAIGVPSYLGITVAENVQVSVRTKFQPIP